MFFVHTSFVYLRKLLNFFIFVINLCLEIFFKMVYIHNISIKHINVSKTIPFILHTQKGGGAGGGGCINLYSTFIIILRWWITFMSQPQWKIYHEDNNTCQEIWDSMKANKTWTFTQTKRKYVKVKIEAFHGFTTLVFTLPKLRLHESPRNQNEV
jgi:hypothetical protein